MEESKIESGKTSGNLTAFPPHRRRHLNSGTYRTLIHILSHCYDYPERSVSDQNVAQETSRDKGINELVQETEKEACGNVELAGPHSTKTDNSADEQVRVADESCHSDDFREKIEQIESILSVEEDEDLLQQKYGVNIENTLPIDLQDVVFGPKSTLMNELEWIVKGNEYNTPKPSGAALDQNLNGIVLDVEPIAQENEIELETFVSSEDAKGSFIPSNEVGLTKEPENFSEKVHVGFDFSAHKDRVAEASKLTKYSKDINSSPETDYMEVEHGMQQKAKEQEKTIAMSSPNDMIDGNIEEGEISGDDWIDDQSNNVILHDTVMLEELKVNEKSEDVIDGKEDPRKKANETDLISNSVLVDMVDEGRTSRGLEFRDSSETQILNVQGKNVKATLIDDSNPFLEGGRNDTKDNGVSMGIGCPATGNLGTIYEGKWDDGSCQKRKRGPPSKEKKERKKAKERKKRAEKERELGVKRLKLQIIQKSKPVVYCRHYIRGRCHEGDKCKFSHDTEPITKSKPCVHFARQSCMKGDDCPYDHQLSKYPCNNFKESGFCARGDRCLFSHKMPSKEDSATASSKPELKPPTVQGNSKSQLVNIGGASQHNAHVSDYSAGIHSRYNTKQNMTETLIKQPELAPKGITFPLISSSPLVHSSTYKQGGLTPSRNTCANAGNQIDQNPLGSVDNSNVTPVSTPPITTPKGINFLSFGKASANDSRGKNQVGHQTSASVSGTIQKMNGMLKANQLVALQGTSFNPFVKSEIAGSTSDKLVSLPSSSDNGSSGHYLQSLNAADKPESSSTISFRQTPSLTGQSSVGMASWFGKDIANSTQRGLFSTLAFAAKYTAQHMNHLTGSTGALVDKETRNSTSLQSDSAKAL